MPSTPFYNIQGVNKYHWYSSSRFWSLNGCLPIFSYDYMYLQRERGEKKWVRDTHIRDYHLPLDTLIVSEASFVHIFQCIHIWYMALLTSTM